MNSQADPDTASLWERRYEEVTKKLEELSQRLSRTEEAQHSEQRLRRAVSQENTNATRLAAETDALRAEVKQLKEKNAEQQKTLVLLQRELTAVQAEQIAFRDDVESAVSDNIKLRAAVTVQQNENSRLKQQLARLDSDVQEVRCEVSGVQTNVTTIRRSSMSAIGNANASTSAGASVISSRTNAFSSRAAHQSDDSSSLELLSNLRSDVENLQTEGEKLASVVSAQKKAVDKLRQDVSSLQGKSGDVLADVSIFRSEAETLIHNFRSQIQNLEMFVAKSGVQVGFHAALGKSYTTKRVETLVCDNVISNIGAGYDPHIGVFTAPVSGMYFFLVNTSPCLRDFEVKARLSVVLENRRVSHVYARGLWWSTGHTALRMETGQRVWLRTFDDDYYTFSEGWTNFTGMLIQPQM